MTLTFAADTHTYMVDGRVVPSVTQVLPSSSFHVDEAHLQETRDEGIRNHSILHALAMGLNPGCVTDREVQVANAIDDFLCAESIGDIILTEQRMHSRRYRYAGTPDLVTDTMILDLKRTTGDRKMRALQLAGYHIMLVENGYISPTNRWWILTTNHKSYTLANVYNELAESVFKGLVQAWHARQALDIYKRSIV